MFGMPRLGYYRRANGVKLDNRQNAGPRPTRP